MLTSKPISTISYNSAEYLASVLNRLEKSHIITKWYFIHHKGETDINGEKEKDHKHVYLCPNRRVDTEELRDLFKEIDANNPKPLGVLPFESSKIDDWLLYAIHDIKYLDSKGMTREYAYPISDIVACDDEQLKRDFKHALDVSNSAVKKRRVISELGIAQAYEMGIATTSEIMTAMAVSRFSREENRYDAEIQQIMIENARLRKTLAEISDRKEELKCLKTDQDFAIGFEQISIDEEHNVKEFYDEQKVRNK